MDDYPALSARDDAAKLNGVIAYGLMIAGLFTGVFWLVGAIWAMVQKGSARGSRFEDHFSSIIATFWWCLILGVVGWFLQIILVGYLIMGLAWCYGVYKVVKGLLKLLSNKPYYT